MHLPPAVGGRVEQTRRRVGALRAWVERTILWRVWERLLENEFVDRSVALAAKAFVSLFPAIIVVAAFLPSSARKSVLLTIEHRAGLTGAALAGVKQAFATSGDVRKATGVLGLILTFFYVSSFVGALQRVYTRAWRRPKTGRVSGYAIAAGWLAAFIAYLGLVGFARRLLGSGPKTFGFLLVAWLATAAIW